MEPLHFRYASKAEIKKWKRRTRGLFMRGTYVYVHHNVVYLGGLGTIVPIFTPKQERDNERERKRFQKERLGVIWSVGDELVILVPKGIALESTLNETWHHQRAGSSWKEIERGPYRYNFGGTDRVKLELKPNWEPPKTKHHCAMR